MEIDGNGGKCTKFGHAACGQSGQSLDFSDHIPSASAQRPILIGTAPPQWSALLYRGSESWTVTHKSST